MPDHQYNIGNRLIDYTEENFEEGLIYYRSVVDLLAEEGIEIDQHRLAKFIDSYYFTIPEYQRDYEWEEPQWDDLWTELNQFVQADLSKGGDRTPDVFFGSMFFAERGTDEHGSIDRLEVIDGQQRLTTLSILFKAIGDLTSEIEPDGRQNEVAVKIQEKVNDVLYRPSEIPGRTPPALKLSQHNRAFYEALIQGPEEQLRFISEQESAHGNRKRHAITVKEYTDKLGIEEAVFDELQEGMPTESFEEFRGENKWFDDANNRLLRAYVYFYDRIEQALREPENGEVQFETPEEQLLALLNVTNYVLHSFIVGYFEVTSNKSSLMMSVFQILNDRGMNLKKVDIIRARIVSCLRDGREGEASKHIQKYESMIDTLNNDYSDVESFLVDFIASREESDSVSSKTDISKNLLEAFEENQSDNVTVTSFITSQESTRQLLDDLKEYAEYYGQIIDEDGEIDLSDETRQDEANEIITRLNKLGHEQWRPLVLSVYGEVKNTGTVAQERYFLRLLRLIESLSFRVSLTNVYPSVQDSIYISACKSFRANGFDDSIFEEVVNEMSRRAGQLFEDQLVDSLVEEFSWNTRTARVLLWKVTADTFYDEATSVTHRLNPDHIHCEHVLPQTPLLGDNADDRYAWLRSFFQTHQRGDVEDLVAHLISTAEKDDQLEGIAEYFVNDIGNMVLLESEENLSLQNNVFSTKLLAYNQTQGFNIIPPNQYFTPEDGVIGRERLEGLRDERTDDIDYFDSFWTYERLTDRKKDLIRQIVESLAFDEIRPEEFGDVDIDTRVQTETDRRLGLIMANYQTHLQQDDEEQ